MSNPLLYQHPTDQRLSAAVTITPSTADAAYPVAGLYDGNPAKPFKFTATTGDIVFDFGSAVQLQLVALIHHNLDAGLNVRIQGNATNTWGAPSLDQAIVIPAYEADGFPINPWIDLSALTNTFRYWRLSFPAANSAIIALGQVWLGAVKRQLVRNVHWGVRERVEKKLYEHVTDYDVSTIYSLGMKVKAWSAFLETSDAGIAAVEQWWDACHGREKPSLVVLDPTLNDARLVRWAEPHREVTRQFLDLHALQVELREVSRGLVL